jgi:acyl carrier protein
MGTAEVQSKVKQVISNVLKMSEDEISNEANFIFDLGADSMQSLELVAAFEEEFEIEMDQEKALEIQTVSDAVNFIEVYIN